MTTLRRLLAPSSGPRYETASDVVRVLDATEHNLERLNARARGACTTYVVATLHGPLAFADCERAVEAMTARHPMLRARIATDANGALVFALDDAAHVSIERVRVPAPRDWAALVEADMNAGPTDSARTLFHVAWLEPAELDDGADGERALVIVGHHAVCDGVSMAALIDEVLETMTAARAWSSLSAVSLVDPFTSSAPEHAATLAALEAEANAAVALADDEARATAAQALHERFAALERALLDRAMPGRALVDGTSRGVADVALVDETSREAAGIALVDGTSRDAAGGALPVELMRVHAWIDRLARCVVGRVDVVAERDLGTSADRYLSARTRLWRLSFTREQTAALSAACRAHGLTVNGALGAALLFAYAERHHALTAGAPSLPVHATLANAVNLRAQLLPPLAPSDVRMAVDIAMMHVPITRGARFWDLARRAGDDTRAAVEKRRALSSFFRTERRDFAVAPPGVPVPLLSNLGRLSVRARYGAVRVDDVSLAMATHGSFQIGTLATTFDDRLAINVYCEAPTISDDAAQRLAAAMHRVLCAVAGGADPTVGLHSSP